MNKKIIPIKYTSRDFESIKSDLIQHAKRYYESSFKDFSEAGFGSLMIDSVAYIGDILSYYLDYQANECFLETAIEYDNLIKLGKQLGYKHKTVSSSYTLATFYVVIPANAVGSPDKNYIPILKAGSSFSAANNINFILKEDVRFDLEPPLTEIRVYKKDSNGNPLNYAIKSYGTVVSGKLKTEVVSIKEFEKFKKILLSGTNIIEILSVYDEEGNEYFEVENLSQNIIYKTITNRDSSTAKNARQIIKPFNVPRRFIVHKDLQETYIQFGGSSVAYESPNMLSEPISSILQMHARDYISDTSFDPTKIINTDKLGVSPSNTKLYITYRYIESPNDVNFPAGSLKQVIEARLEFKKEQDLLLDYVRSVKSSITVENETPILGDVSSLTSDELKLRMQNCFAVQDRAVTIEDYKSLAYSMPASLGAIKRINVIRDDDSFKRNLNIYILSEDQNRRLCTANQIIKQNLKTWLSSKKMINDSIDILDGKIVNYGIEFIAIGDKSKTSYDILSLAIEQLRKDFSRLPDFGEPIAYNDYLMSLKKVKEIVDVTYLKIIEKVGTTTASILGNYTYSDSTFSFERNESLDKRFLNVPQNVVMELKYPLVDIKGSII